MARVRTSLAATLGIVALSIVPTMASAQNGWAYFVPTLSGPDGGIYRTFVQGSNGLEETFTDEFTPGTHTMARIEARYNNCTASADNVTFTITAGTWTEVDVPMTFTTCSMPINMEALGLPGGDGEGTVQYVVPANVGPAQTIATCTISQVAGPQFYAWANFHGCQGDAPYGDSIVVTLSPAVGSTFPDTEYVIAGTKSDYYYVDWGFSKSPHPFPSGISAKADLSITLVGGSAQGFVSSSVFRIVNHGPNNALGIHVVATVPGSEHGDVSNLMSIQDGYCDFEVACELNELPVGDSTTVTLRTESVPDLELDPSEQFPTATATCSDVTVTSLNGPPDAGPPDANTSNNHATCVTTSVPVTVALGGATPISRTVTAGSSDVPMVEFLVSPSSQQTVTGVTVQASGTGNEQTDVTAVKLYIDRNANGAIDAGDSVVATGTFAANDGTVTLAVNPGLVITAPTALMVTYSFSVTVAERLGGAIMLAFFPLFLIPVTRNRKTLLAMLLVMITSVAVVSCGGDTTGPKQNNGSVTFKSTLTGVGTTAGSVANLSVAGATITVDK